ncbi:permease prefix domain 1-containing protein [Actinoplanes xinjiangensis]|uniref:permease prefix domain 1-containing protein n=1 Tax=Actinoplanes xinjiangensis TaxID=512350 RepID=UPI0034493C50
MTTLIDRYVFTVLRRVPEQQRSDIERELRTSIADAVDARVDGGTGHDTAVEQTLLELGDPDRLADGYADRPRYLIGPAVYPAWKRLLTMLLSVVLPVVVTVAVVIRVLGDATFGEVVGTAIGTTLTVGAHMTFWSTLTFALLERTGVTRAGLPGRAWTLDDLPQYEPGFLTPAQLWAAVIWPVLVIAALVVQQFAFTDEPVLDPANWSFWWPYLIVVLILEGLYAVWLARRGAWSHTVTLANAALAVLFAGPLVWLAATGRFFNPAWIATLNWGDTDPLTWLPGIVIVIAVAGALYDIAEVAVRAERARRGLATAIPGTGREFSAPHH